MSKIAKATLLQISGRELLERPDADEVYVLQWDEAQIEIPWPAGKTVKQAICSWAGAQQSGLRVPRPAPVSLRSKKKS